MGQCPTCGHRTTLTPLAIGRYLTPQQQRIYELVRRAMPEGLTAWALYDRMYSSRPTGSESPKVIHVLVWQMNRRLAAYGLAVRAPRGAGARYVICHTD